MASSALDSVRPKTPSGGQFRRFARGLERVVGLLALLVVPAILLEDHAPTEGWRRFALGINWLVWLAFCADLVVQVVARPSWTTIRKNWFNVLLIVVSPPFLVPDYLQAARGLRVIRLVKAVRLARAGVVAGVGFKLSRQLFLHRKFHYVAIVTIVVVFLSAFGMFIAEGNVNRSVESFGDALWWSLVTATTVGFADMPPQTGEGRVIALILMMSGIGVVGVFTATVASFFFAHEHEHDQATQDLKERLDSIERKMDRLLKRVEELSKSTTE